MTFPHDGLFEFLNVICVARVPGFMEFHISMHRTLDSWQPYTSNMSTWPSPRGGKPDTAWSERHVQYQRNHILKGLYTLYIYKYMLSPLYVQYMPKHVSFNFPQFKMFFRFFRWAHGHHFIEKGAHRVTNNCGPHDMTSQHFFFFNMGFLCSFLRKTTWIKGWVFLFILILVLYYWTKNIMYGGQCANKSFFRKYKN